MGDKTGIEWTEATMVDRGGRRVRTYVRQDPTRPGSQLRRQMAALGQRWCRECRAWLEAAAVTKNGLCRPHENELYRRNYAANPTQIRSRVHARKRSVDPVPPEASLIAELFDGLCAYCPRPATTWDHVIPIVVGGRTAAGNLVPACVSCNSSKNARDVWEWLEGRQLPNPYVVEYLMAVA